MTTRRLAIVARAGNRLPALATLFVILGVAALVVWTAFLVGWISLGIPLGV
jgi:p-aminobenzoyl-glutamate transporter AbgT